MFSIGNLRSMEVIDITTGSKLGFIRDLKIDCNGFRIISILLPNQKVSWFSKNDFIEIPWAKVIKIGLDVILVESDDLLLDNKV